MASSTGDALPRTADVVVIGAGLAGLAAAVRLMSPEAGPRAPGDTEVLVLEASDAPGGRIRTDVAHGLTFDRGFQLYNPAYPQGRAMFDHDALQLRPFTAGVRVRLDDGWAEVADPRRDPGLAWSSLRAQVGSLAAKLRFGAYATGKVIDSAREIESSADVSMAAALESAGIGAELIDTTIRPFLTGVFLEPDLATSRRFGDLVLRSFVRGTPSVPASGMQALPEQLAARLPDGVLRLSTAASAISTDGDRHVVATAQGPIRARVVLVATSSTAAESLLPGFSGPPTNTVTTWYHVADCPADALAGNRPILTVDGRGRGQGPIVNTVPITHAAPEYAPPGTVLVSSSALGLHPDADAERAARAHLAELYGVSTSGWELAACYPVEDALPAMTAPFEVRRTLSPAGAPRGVLVAGDHRDTSSIQGALASGRRAAERISDLLG